MLPPAGSRDDDVRPTDETDGGFQQVQLKEATLGPLGLPPIIVGTATFSTIYNSEEYVAGHTPLETVRLALRCGLCAFDTAPFYRQSEGVLGEALTALRHEFPRRSYHLITKCGRYCDDDDAAAVASFDYSPEAIRASVKRSLDRLHTDYLDVVYLHDVEFVGAEVAPRKTGNPLAALGEEKAAYGLEEGGEAKIWGPGDRIVLDAILELRKLKEEGLVRNIGISGFPLPTLLRFALLVRHTPPYEPLDAVQSYAHLTLQNAAFVAFAGALRARAHVAQPLSASPLSMGLLTPAPPVWHAAPPALRDASARACARLLRDGGLPRAALGFSLGAAAELDVPVVVGLSNPDEVRECVQVWTQLRRESLDDKQKRTNREGELRRLFEDAGFLDWSWACPAEES